jgi:hypothetical protein
MMLLLGHGEFVVDLTQHSAVLQAELVALVEGRVAHRAREAVHVEHQVTRAHHHFGEQDGGLTPGATLHAEQPATQYGITCTKMRQKCTKMHEKCTKMNTKCAKMHEN